MKRILKRTLTLGLAVVMSLGLLSSCGKKKPDEDKPTGGTTTTAPTGDKGAPKVIRIGSHNAKGGDPTYKDPVTGQVAMAESKLQGTLRALEAVKKELNVDVKYIQYNGNVTEVLLKSVLANDPICELAETNSSQGVVIGQNVLQPLEEYEPLFKNTDNIWMFPEKAYGHVFLLNWDMEFIRTNALVYNITYLQKVDTLKESGKTVLPTDLWKKGEWTWSRFEDYLTKVKTYYANKKAPIRTEKFINAFEADVAIPALASVKTRGETIFGPKGIAIDSEDTKKGIGYVDSLVAKGLIIPTPVGGNYANDFMNGESVFSTLANWQMAKAGDALSKRGEAMGIVPYARPDDLEKDDPRYQMVVNTPGQIGVLKGMSKEMMELSVKTHILYFSEMFKGRTNSNAVMEYFKSREFGKSEALVHGFDVSNEEYGEDMVDAYMVYNPNVKSNEAYNFLPWKGQFDAIIRNSITGANGVPKYDVAIAEQKQAFIDQIDTITKNVSMDKIVDNIAPSISLINKDIALTKGTDGKTIDWSKYIKITDNVDGDLDIKSATIDASKIKFDTAGFYDKSLLISAKDKEGNEKKAQMGVVIYDPDNKEAPVLTMKKTYRAVKLNEDASKINWGKDFVEAATSKEGFDLKAYVTADISSLDVTAGGTYDVTLTVTDYAGNKTEQKIKVTVEGK